MIHNFSGHGQFAISWNMETWMSMDCKPCNHFPKKTLLGIPIAINGLCTILWTWENVFL